MKNLISIFKVTTIFLFLITSVPVIAQFQADNLKEDTVVKNYNHVIYGNGAGIYIPFGIIAYSWSINYEYFFEPKKTNYSLRVGLGIGTGTSEYGIYEENGDGPSNFINPRVVLLTGKRNSHFELSGGAYIKFLHYQISNTESVSETSTKPSLTIGYRYQKPKGGFMFRTGFSIPETIYVGLGYSF